MLLVFTANPEDYTNRGNIITPLKDRIDSQILTHYPRSIDEGKRITAHEITHKGVGAEIPEFIRDMIEEVSFQARASEFVNQASGVSARVSISAYENFLSNIERRALINKDDDYFPRMCDIYSIIPAITGKIELVYEGEQEGPVLVSYNLIGAAIKSIFSRYFPKPNKERSQMDRGEDANPFEAVTDYFSSGKKLELSDNMPFPEYKKRLEAVSGLREIVKKYFNTENGREFLLRMEFVLEALHQNNLISREIHDAVIQYSDVFSKMLSGMGGMQ
jgi:magnesium chelatase subunit I